WEITSILTHSTWPRASLAVMIALRCTTGCWSCIAVIPV
ncbi:MAG: hypothetical protein, partial [Olavius algarvensis Gamma 3 endosymbiont]